MTLILLAVVILGISSAGPSPVSASTAVLGASDTQGSVTLSDIPAYSGSPYTEINDNVPFFSSSDMTEDAFESYSDLDSLGRCGIAYANVCTETMPTKERGDIGSVKPTGWHTVKYDGIDGDYLYNRCHLIGYQLSGENANEKNLITGTRYLNVEGMEPFENMVADYVKETDCHVLYRVTPMFDGDNLLATGVLMEAESVEDRGGSILFNVFCYNVQPGITINYADGSSSGPAFTGSDAAKSEGASLSQDQNQEDQPAAVYIGNSNTKKFHLPTCPSVSQMSDSSKVTFSSRDEAIADGYEPCKRCHP